MKRVYINWYYAGNLGDDLLVANFINKTNFDEYAILNFMWASKESKLQSKKALNKLIAKDKKVVFLNKAFPNLKPIDERQDNYLAYIGGSLWPEGSIDRKIKQIKNLKNEFPNMKIVSIGNNLSQYKNSKTRESIKKLFKLFDFYTLRDLYSVQYVENENSLFHDPIYSYDFSKLDKMKEKNYATVSISKSDIVFDYEFNFKDVIKDIVKNVKDRNISKVHLVSFQDKKDLDLFKYLSKKMKKEKIKIKLIEYNGDPLKIIYEIRNSKINYSIRFHSIVLSNLFMKNQIAYDYDNKNLNHVKDINKRISEEFKLTKNELQILIDSSQKQFDEFNSWVDSN